KSSGVRNSYRRSVIVFLKRVHQAGPGGYGLALRSGGFRLPQERLSMRKFKEVLRLHSLGLKQQQIARSCSIAQSTLHHYLKRAWPPGGTAARVRRKV